MKHTQKLMWALCACVLTLISASADNYNYLNFVNAGEQITQFGTEGLKMTFDGGKATVVAGGRTQTISLATMAYLEFSNTQVSGTTYITGDINGDGSIDVNDINALVNIMLGREQRSSYPGQANVDGDPDDSVDVADINVVLNIMLHN